MMISGKTKICMIVGDPVEHSLTPKMFNCAFETLGLAQEFVFVGTRVANSELINAIKGIRALNIRAITVTHPHKEAVMPLLDNIDTVAKKIGAVNTIINSDGKLKGFNTDYIGVVEPIKKRIDLAKKSVAILGAGGAARAAVYAMTTVGANVTVFNRTVEKAKSLADEFNCNFEPLENVKIVKNMDIIINLTPVSMDKNSSPVANEFLGKHQIVFDAVYSPFETKLLQGANEKGATIVHGTEWLLHQAIQQFKIYTGKDAPVKVMKQAILEGIKG